MVAMTSCKIQVPFHSDLWFLGIKLWPEKKQPGGTYFGRLRRFIVEKF